MPGTPSPFRTLVASGARRRRRNAGAARARSLPRPVDPGPAWWPFRNLPASTPPCLRPTCWFPKVPAWSRSSPNSPRGLHQALDQPLRSGPEGPSHRSSGQSPRAPSFGGSSVPSGSDSPCRVRRGGIMRDGLASVNPNRPFPQHPRGFPQGEGRSCTGGPQNVGESLVNGLRWARWSSQATRMAPARSAPRAVRAAAAPVAARTTTELVVPWIAAAAPEAPTSSNLTRSVTW